ncbi:hypothetical protein PRIPAC_89666 [Pristionchus pacificus]|uniref:Uncharacterized protein n=1 Tax=Pristionchus pacificus TaxID=54126 RepID=A0A2A6B741_PRIPA|nr:hypothetical protein PRIPAC_89666 [Pristionchus pacificus]|eukprot:PDM61695.1 hypothetical protein PRIPAC_51137 [Pristionchus pacificus]
MEGTDIIPALGAISFQIVLIIILVITCVMFLAIILLMGWGFLRCFGELFKAFYIAVGCASLVGICLIAFIIFFMIKTKCCTETHPRTSKNKDNEDDPEKGGKELPTKTVPV